MQLHDPASAVVFLAKPDEQPGLEAGGLAFGERFVVQAQGEDVVQRLFVEAWGEAQHFKAVVGGDAAMRGEVVQAHGKRGGQVVEAADGVAGRCFEFL